MEPAIKIILTLSALVLSVILTPAFASSTIGHLSSNHIEMPVSVAPPDSIAKTLIAPSEPHVSPAEAPGTGMLATILVTVLGLFGAVCACVMIDAPCDAETTLAKPAPQRPTAQRRSARNLMATGNVARGWSI